MADELGGALEHLAGGRDQGLAKVMDDRQGTAPVATNIFQHVSYFCGVLRADSSALEHLAAYRVHADQQDPASLFTRSVDVKNMATAIAHILSQERRALLVNDREVRDEFLRQITQRARRDLDPMST